MWCTLYCMFCFKKRDERILTVSASFIPFETNAVSIPVFRVPESKESLEKGFKIYCKI